MGGDCSRATTMPTKRLARPVHSRGDGFSSPWGLALGGPGCGGLSSAWGAWWVVLPRLDRLLQLACCRDRPGRLIFFRFGRGASTHPRSLGAGNFACEHDTRNYILPA